MSAITQKRPDINVITLTLLAILAISLLLQHEFALTQAVLFLIGTGLGITLVHALFGFTGGWRQFTRERNSVGIRAQILLLAGTSIIFFPIVGQSVPELNGFAALGQVGVSVFVGAFLFGIGMQLGGGCGSGTLYTVGWGHTDMLITLAFFIIGSTLGSVHLPWWISLPNIGEVSLIKSFGWLPALIGQLVVLAILYIIVRAIELHRHQQLTSLNPQLNRAFSDRLIFGPWPLLWGVAGLMFFNLLTMLVAGHPWSITFAFGLWGTKIWQALGGDISSWQYWSGGYPQQALNSSVLADTTSIMNFGIILGALLAAALAGKFAPDSKLKFKRIITAIIGGLLLGYGARLAFGCNIGALLAGISTGSLHGWAWLLAGFSGSILGIHIKIWMGMDKPIGGKAA